MQKLVRSMGVGRPPPTVESATDGWGHMWASKKSEEGAI